MSAAALVVWLMGVLSSGNPYAKSQPPSLGPAFMVDLKVREWRTDRFPTSYQITLTIPFQ